MPTDWVWVVIGGLMIGAAAAVQRPGNGRIIGAHGIVGGLIDETEQDRSTTIAFFDWTDWNDRVDDI